jgi:hypothetical protein
MPANLMKSMPQMSLQRHSVCSEGGSFVDPQAFFQDSHSRRQAVALDQAIREGNDGIGSRSRQKPISQIESFAQESRGLAVTTLLIAYLGGEDECSAQVVRIAARAAQ